MGGRSSKQKQQTQQPSRVSEQDRAVLQLKSVRDKLKQYQKRIEQQLERDRDVARQLLAAGKRDKARLLLRKKKYLEGLLQKTDAQLDSIGQLVHDLEFSQIESQVVVGLKFGNESLKRINELISLADVEQLMDETAEAAQYQRQISDLLAAAGGGSLTEDDESAVLAELEALCAPADAGEPPVVVELPSVPEHEVVSTDEIAASAKKARRQGPVLAS